MPAFDRVKFVASCPFCGELIKEFQTHDGDVCFKTVDTKNIGNWFSTCDECQSFIEFEWNDTRNNIFCRATAGFQPKPKTGQVVESIGPDDVEVIA